MERDCLDVIALQVFLAAGGGLGIDVEGKAGCPGPQPRCRDAQDARAATQIEEARDGHRPARGLLGPTGGARIGNIFGQSDRQSGRGMCSRPEGATRIQVDDQLACRYCYRVPARPHHEAPPHASGAKELLPHVAPLALIRAALSDYHRIDRKPGRSGLAPWRAAAADSTADRSGGAHSATTVARPDAVARRVPGIAQLHAPDQGTDRRRHDLGGGSVYLELNLKPRGQRITRLLASRRRRLRASRIFRLRLTDGFSW